MERPHTISVGIGYIWSLFGLRRCSSLLYYLDFWWYWLVGQCLFSLLAFCLVYSWNRPLTGFRGPLWSQDGGLQYLCSFSFYLLQSKPTVDVISVVCVCSHPVCMIVIWTILLCIWIHLNCPLIWLMDLLMCWSYVWIYLIWPLASSCIRFCNNSFKQHDRFLRSGGGSRWGFCNMFLLFHFIFLHWS